MGNYNEEETKAACAAMLDRCRKEIYSPNVPSTQVMADYVGVLYGEMKKPVPKITLCTSRVEALNRAEDLLGERRGSFTRIDSVGAESAGWVASLVISADLGHLDGPTNAPKVDACRKLLAGLTGGIFGTVLLDEEAFVIQSPRYIHVDDKWNLHRGDGPAISWGPDDEACFWRGTSIPKELTTGESISSEQVLGYSTEVRRALGEIRGWKAVFALLRSEMVSEWVDPKTSLSYRLWSSDGGMKWIEKQSPVIKDGSQPTYIEPVHEDLETAQAARRWQVPPFATVEECEEDPELEYEFES